jgi:arginyl-tRNA synthetase
VLAKAGAVDADASSKADTYDIEKVLMRFEPIVRRAIVELAPQHVAGYLIELAGAFNSWYAQEKIIGDDNEAYKLVVTRKVAHTLERGLFALGIKAPVRM